MLLTYDRIIKQRTPNKRSNAKSQERSTSSRMSARNRAASDKVYNEHW